MEINGVCIDEVKGLFTWLLKMSDYGWKFLSDEEKLSIRKWVKWY